MVVLLPQVADVNDEGEHDSSETDHASSKHDDANPRRRNAFFLKEKKNK